VAAALALIPFIIKEARAAISGELLERECANQLDAGPRSPQLL
jgi:hypothetical protein